MALLQSIRYINIEHKESNGVSQPIRIEGGVLISSLIDQLNNRHGRQLEGIYGRYLQYRIETTLAGAFDG
ncbi:MAG: hypothetical protein ACREXR_12610 [Gammaproteobacteria bacterium]